ncbi:MAG: phosphotransacetylase [Nanoarchaeota archaeon]|nr:phosphotransacetylase [Nanoarchaeota archaeon]
MMLERISEQVKGVKKIVLVDTDDARCYRAVDDLLRDGICNIVLVGNADRIAKQLSSVWKGKVIIYDPATSELTDKFADEYFNLRKEKGMNKAQALMLMKQPVYFGVMLVRKGLVDGLVAGLSSMTKPFVPAFHLIGLQENVKRASSFFVMEKGKQVFLFADAAVQEFPSAEELAEIGLLSAASAKLLGLVPKIAFLSYSTLGSASHEQVKKVELAVKLAKRQSKVILDGELQVDAALVPAVAVQKKSSIIKGDANVLIFPDLNAGNIGYKLLQHLGGFKAIGPILQGLQKSVNDLSRGASVDDIIDVVAITVLQAMHK